MVPSAAVMQTLVCYNSNHQRRKPAIGNNLLSGTFSIHTISVAPKDGTTVCSPAERLKYTSNDRMHKASHTGNKQAVYSI